MKCMENIDYKVIVHSITYNHSAYITDTMDGFSKQKTNFPFICAIIDDASSDGEQRVIHDYIFKHFKNIEEFEYNYGGKKCADIIYAQHSENKNCFFIAILLLENHYSQKKSHLKRVYVKELVGEADYVALCEGDDYWIEESKLQKQIDFLDEHPDYSMSYTGFFTVDDDKKQIYRANYEKAMQRSKTGDILQDLLITNFILTCTTVYRYDCYFSKLYEKVIYKYDYSLFLTASVLGKCHYLPERTSAYRKTPTGAMATQHDLYSRFFHETKLFFYDGLTNGSIEIEKNRLTTKLLKQIVSYCLYTDDKVFKDRYAKILKNNMIRKYYVWSHLKFFIVNIYQKLKLR